MVVKTAAAADMRLGERGIFVVKLIQSELMELISQNLSSDLNVETEFQHCALFYSQDGVDEALSIHDSFQLECLSNES